MPGKIGSASFSVLLADGFNLLAAKVKNFTHKVEAVQERTDGLGDSSDEHSPTGAKKASLTQDGAFFDDSAAGMHEALKASQDTKRILCFAFAGNVIGNAFVGLQGVYGMAYDVLGKLNGLTNANVAYQVSGRLDRGVILQHHVEKTATWNTEGAESVDNAASSANGGVGYLQVSAMSGFTGFVGKIRHSADDITYADLITFTNVTAAPAGGRLEVSGTVNRHLAVSGTLTGAGTIKPFIGFSRS